MNHNWWTGVIQKSDLKTRETASPVSYNEKINDIHSSKRRYDGSDYGNEKFVQWVSKDLKEALSKLQNTFVVSDATKQDYPIIYASHIFFKITGYSPKEVIGTNWCAFLFVPYFYVCVSHSFVIFLCLDIHVRINIASLNELTWDTFRILKKVHKIH